MEKARREREQRKMWQTLERNEAQRAQLRTPDRRRRRRGWTVCLGSRKLRPFSVLRLAAVLCLGPGHGPPTRQLLKLPVCGASWDRANWGGHGSPWLTEELSSPRVCCKSARQTKRCSTRAMRLARLGKRMRTGNDKAGRSCRVTRRCQWLKISRKLDTRMASKYRKIDTSFRCV